MLFRNYLSFLAARGIPALVNLLAVAIYTRLLTEEEFGKYALILSIVGFGHVILIQWLSLILGRFYQASHGDRSKVLSHIAAIFLAVAVSVGLFAGCAALAVADVQLAALIALAVALLISQGWHEINLGLHAAKIDPMTYGRQLGLKVVLALAVGTILAISGGASTAPVIGLIVGSVVAALAAGRGDWRGVAPKFPSEEDLRSYLSYGLPLALTFGLVWITSRSDRLIVALLLDEAAAGVYVVGYDLAQQSVGVLLAIVNTAATPLAIRAMERDGLRAARQQMRLNGEMVMAVAVAGAAGLVALGPLLVELLVGQRFRAGALEVLPYIAATAAIVGIKSFYLDIAFHLSKRSRWLIVTSGLSAAISIVLNFALIPLIGISGAAVSSISAYAVASIASYVIGKRVFPMPSVWPMLAKSLVLGAATFSAAKLPQFFGVSSVLSLLAGLMLGTLALGLTWIVLDTTGLRHRVVRELEKWFGPWLPIGDKWRD